MKTVGKGVTQKSRRRWVIAAVGLPAVVGATWLLTAGDRPLGEQLGFTPAVSLRCEPDADFSATYRLTMQTALKLNAAALIADPRLRGQTVKSDAGYSARLKVRAMEQRADATVLAMQLDRIEATSGSVAAPRELMAELRQPFFALLGHDCRISQAGFAPDLSDEAINRQQALVHSLSVVVDGKPDQRTWTTTERDNVGEYAARYEREAGDDSRRFVKERTAYSKVHPQVGPRFKEPLLVRILESKTPAEIDEQDAWLARLDTRDHLQVTRADASLVADLKFSLKLEQDRDDGVPLDVELLADLRWRSDREPPLNAVPRRPDPPDFMKTITLDAALEQYAELLRSGRGFGHAADFLSLVLRAQPGLAYELMAMLERNAIAADIEGTVFLALERAGTPEAHNALIQGLSDDHASRNRARAAAALPDIPTPSQQTLTALATTAREAQAETKDDTQLVRNSATYAMGALEQRTRDKNPELAKQTVNEIRGQLGQVNSPSALTAALDAIGNSGNPDFIQDLKPHLDAKEPLIRAHAIEAMGHMDPQTNKDVFRELIDGEQDPRIRGSIARTYADQARRADSLPPPEVVRGALDVLVSEPDPGVRGLLIELVGSSCASDPSAMQALAAQFKRENDPMLLKLIGRYVPADKLGT
jgi:hypothetical protein